MSSHARGPIETDAAAAIRQQLQRVLESSSFRTSKRCSGFLRHVVEGICEGRSDSLKERTLGVAVFAREPNYDTNQDPVVRNTAGEVRKRLAQYYCEPGREQEIRIVLPPGSYVPEIQVPAVVEPILPAATLPPERRSASVPASWLIAGAIVLAGVLVASFWLRTRKTDLDRFWAPVVNYPGPITFCIGQPHVYRLNPSLDQFFDSDEEARKASPQARATVPLLDITPASTRYISLGDAQTLTRLSGFAARYGKDIDLRGDRTTSLVDLRGRPVVLIGGYNNQWTKNLTGDLRFYFAQDEPHNIEYVADRQNPSQRTWQVRADLPNERTPMDYAIVTRVFNRTTEQVILVAAGINRMGTNAAGEFLTQQSYLADALKQAPGGWEKKNMQVVLATKLYAGNPGPPTVVASYFW